MLSRRDLAQLLATERAARELARRQRGRRVQWHEPDIAWVTDAIEVGADRAGRERDLVRQHRSAFGHPGAGG